MSFGGQGRADHCAAAKAHDGQAGGEASAIRKPFNERGNRGNVAETKADTADDAAAKPHEPELVEVHAQGGQGQTAWPANGGDEAGLARAGAFQPAAEQGSGGTEHDNGQGEDGLEVTGGTSRSWS